ncbi:hypothetical protein HUJ04_007082 [Dendroctonus ponderosae]|nr:hypothetical protein HUJ04_007082 [Dendroctonus ponderosae]KAH1015745.1 hypothetical protein HUJ04_007082 [Dendroctonus ponderosae]KAH1025020.1 hypothetical protein HUJ05_009833 [Dendroctonus ponderosae]KAH1025021.1 hypothetical protein HUJ05_009833 [Dendroctonus ponderosae]
MAESPDSFNSAKVKDLIFAYERQVSHTDPLEEYYYEGRQRAKSIGNVLSYKNFREPELKINNILDIEKELVKIEAHLNYYEVYEKDTHVAFQEQLFSVLTNIVSIDPEGHESTIQKKRELIGETQKLATILNLKLPTDGSHSYRGVRRTYISAIRKEENVHSSTSLRNKEHRVTSTTSHSTVNSGFQSEESLNSTKDSIEFSSKQEDAQSEDLKKSEDATESQTPPLAVVQNDPEAEPKSSSAVSKLKRFFSFKRDEKPAIHVTAAAYSGVTRSQSLNLKTSRYVLTKRDKTEERKQREEIISESEEGNEDDSVTNTSTTSSNRNGTGYTQEEKISEGSVDPTLYVETVKDIEEYRDVQTENIRNVSVSKLKSLFEDSRRESGEGLALLTKKPNVYGSAYDLNLPNAQTNFSPFRLTRTISGNYMNFVGLLRNVDIEKNGDLNKSKSLSDLKVASLSYETNRNVRQVDLSQELDGDDDNDDFNQDSIEVRRESSTSADAGVNTEQTLETVKAREQKDIQFFEKVSGGNVELLKKTFEETKNNKHKQDSKHVVNEKVEPVLYSEDPLVKPEVRNNEHEIVNQTQVILDNLEDAHSIEAHQEFVDVLVKGKVEILKKAFDGNDEGVLNSNNIEKPEPRQYVIAPQTSAKAVNTSLVEKQSIEINVNKHEIHEFVSIESTGYSTGSNGDSEQSVEVEQVVTPGIVGVLKNTFEHINTSTVVENNEDTNHAVTKTVIEPVRYTTADRTPEIVEDSIQSTDAEKQQTSKDVITIEPVLYNISLTEETNVKDLTNHEAAITQLAEVTDDTDKNKTNNSILAVSTELIGKQYEDEPAKSSKTAQIVEKKSDLTHSKRKTLQLPVELRIENYGELNDTTGPAESPSKVPIDLYNGGEITIENAKSETSEVVEGGFQSKTDTFMKILDSPSVSLTAASSTRVSQRILSSSSSQLSSMNYLQALKEPNSYSIITISNPKDEDSVEIVELADSQEELSKSQDTILEEILKNGETIQNVDEEFEKLLRGN